MKDGLAAGLTHFENIKTDARYNLDERELNLTGYEFLNNGKTDEALAIFKLNVEANPRSGNVYDSYAEALLKQGKKDEAIENYKTAISLDPRNENAIKLLQGLGVDTDKIKIVNYDLFDADEQWANEIFHFPLHFAPTIEYQGWEDAQFPRSWSKVDSADFWSYTFAWKIDKPGPISQEELVTNLQKYFDGIMASVNKDIGKVLPKTKATLREKDSSEGPKQYTGRLELYDSFITKDTFTLNVEANVHHCEGKSRSILEFRFSPKGFDHAIWDKLHQVTLRSEVCE
jgi:tetratricopeptide (TPR) repeat protein